MEKCKTKLVPKLIANQNKFTKKIIDRMYKRRVKEELGQGKKKADLEKQLKKINISIVFIKNTTYRKLTTLPKTYQCFQRFFKKKYIYFVFIFFLQFFL